MIDVTPAEIAVQLVTSGGRISRALRDRGGRRGQRRRAQNRDCRNCANVVPALECEVTLSSAEMEPLMQTARFDFGFVPAGYAWVFPKRDHLSIGVLTTKRGAANLPEYYRRYLDLLGIGKPLREEKHGYMIPCRPREECLVCGACCSSATRRGSPIR